MSADRLAGNTAAAVGPASEGPWGAALQRLRRDRIGCAAALVVAAYLALILLTVAGLVASDWDTQSGISFAPPSWLGGLPEAEPSAGASARADTSPVDLYGLTDPLAEALAQPAPGGTKAADGGVPARRPTLALGGDKWGRSIALKVLKGAETSVAVGLGAALLATLIGTLLGALAGYLGGWVDAWIDWIYAVFTAIPYLLLVFAVAAVLHRQGVLTLIVILGVTGWPGTYRLIRAEYLKHAARPYVDAARAIGASPLRRMLQHILPNVSHVILVELSQQVVSYIKAEVILSFLGFGVPVDVVSWGAMLNEAPGELVLGKWWQMAVAGTAMAVFVTAFALFTDALRDALDPRLD